MFLRILFLFTVLLFFSNCQKEILSPSQRSTSQPEYTTSSVGSNVLYTIHTETGTLIDIGRDQRGFIRIYTTFIGHPIQTTRGTHLSVFTIKSSNGAAYRFTLSELIKRHAVNKGAIMTSISGTISVLQDDIVLFEEGKNNTSPGVLYTIKSSWATFIDVLYTKFTYHSQSIMHSQHGICQGCLILTYCKIVVLNKKPGLGTGDTATDFLIKTTNGEFRFTSNDVANSYSKGNTLKASLNGSIRSISNHGVYLYNTVEPKRDAKREAPADSNLPCDVDKKETFVYDVNTETYASSPVGSGTFSIKRAMDGKIVLYQKNSYGAGNSSVNYEISTSSGTFSFNEANFLLAQNEKRVTNLSGWIIVKRNGEILFDEKSEVLKEMPALCTTDFYYPNSNSNRKPRGIGEYFYPAAPTSGSPLVLRVKFMGGALLGFKHLVWNTIQAWTQHAHISFKLLDDNASEDAEIRIMAGESSDDIGSYSAVGVQALTIPADHHTMSLPVSRYLKALGGEISMESIKRTILHEFGHALGLVHEHQHPNVPFEWNKPQVYLTYGSIGLTDAEVDRNFFQAYNGPTVTNSNQYDSQSIMNYAFSPKFFMDCATRIALSYDLSQGDIDFIGKMYPKPKTNN